MAITDLVSELRTLAASVQATADRGKEAVIDGPVKALLQACANIEPSWSGSWMGYHSTVYYRGFQQPPHGAYFTPEWGLMTGIYGGGSPGDWVEYQYSDVIDAIEQMAGQPDLGPLDEYSRNAKTEFMDGRAEFLSILAALPTEYIDSIIDAAIDEVNKFKLASQEDFIRMKMPSGQFASRDTRAVHEGFRNPPHVGYQAGIISKGVPGSYCGELATVADRIANHLTRRMRTMSPKEASSGDRVFIGHGGSQEWLLLKNYLQDAHDLKCDDFNRTPTAGYATTARLGTMLSSAAFALIVATAEDEAADGTMHARENVVHEAGLFQGRLGFTKAIVVLEDGCAEFSNIEGLGQIRFPKGKISTKFHEIDGVLRREGIIP